MDSIASSVAGVSPERQAKRVQMNASKAQASKRNATATVELVDAPLAANDVEKKQRETIQKHPSDQSTKGRLINIVA